MLVARHACEAQALIKQDTLLQGFFSRRVCKVDDEQEPVAMMQNVDQGGRIIKLLTHIFLITNE